MANKKTPKKRKKSSKSKGSKIFVVFVIIVVIALLAYFGFEYTKKDISSKDIAATVNNKEITVEELDSKYSELPEQYASLITKEQFLDQMINVELLMQEAKKEGISVDDEEIEAELVIAKEQFPSVEEFDKFLQENGLTEEIVKLRIEEQLIVGKFLDAIIYSKLEVSEEQINSFYKQNKELINAELDDELKAQIEGMLLKERADMAVETYITQLRANSEIIYGEKEEIIINEFIDTESRICKKDGKAVVLFFSTSKCSTCDWVAKAFNKVADKYESQGKITAYHWELDTGDDLRTEEIEEGISKEALESFKKNNEKSIVPAFVLGCKYVRVGNSGSQSLEVEEDEFTKFIEKIIE